MFKTTFDEVWLSNEICLQRSMRAHAKKILLICPDEDAQTENRSFVSRCEKQIERLSLLRNEAKVPYDGKTDSKMLVFDYLDELSLQRRFAPLAYKNAQKQLASMVLRSIKTSGTPTIQVA